MPQYYVRETFFRPDEHSRELSALPAGLVNGLWLLLARHGRENLFVPIRTMQYQAIVDRDEVVFVDSHGGYAHQDGVGGRLIRLAWRPRPAAERDSISAPVPCEIVYYFPDLQTIHRRLITELNPVIALNLERQRGVQAGACAVVPFRRP